MAEPSLADLRDRRSEIIELARARGASRVRVFGSVARGEAVEGSDIDLLVDLEPGRGLLDLGGLVMDLSELLDCIVVVTTEQLLRPRVARHAVAHAIDL